jgi:lytic cellulose monooxygenase (C4-dehydrogenating)
MSSYARTPWRNPRRVVPLVLLALILPATVVLIVTMKAPDASAHGTVVNPMTRNYGCLQRWTTNGASFQDPTMAQKDPMCWQAWQANAGAMWGWNGLYKDNTGGRTSSYSGPEPRGVTEAEANHKRALPDGELCSGGGAANGTFAAMDKPGNWTATPLPNNFTITLHDGARHGSDYNLVYITKQGFNVQTQPLRWSDLELVHTGPRVMPGQGTAGDGQQLNGVNVSIGSINAGARTGNHIVFTIWQASHSDQSYYLCSDVRFGGGSGNPTPTPTPTSAPPSTIAPTTTWGPTPTTPTPTTPTPTTPTPTVTTPPAGSGGCSASYRVVGSWPAGFQGEVRVTAGSTPIRGWRVTGTFADGQTITQAWNATSASSGALDFSNAAWNGSLSAGGSAVFGFLGRQSGTNAAPTLTCSAT